MRCHSCNGILNPTFPPEQRCRCARKPEPSADAAFPDDASSEPQPPDTPSADSAPQSDQETNPYGTSGVGYPD